VATDPGKVDVIKHWPVHLNAQEVRSFLGMAGYYKKIVQVFGAISRPLESI